MSPRIKVLRQSRAKPEKVSPGSAWGDDPAYSVAEAATSIGVSRKAMYDYLAARKIGHVCLGGQKFIRRSHLLAFLARGEVKAV